MAKQFILGFEKLEIAVFDSVGTPDSVQQEAQRKVIVVDNKGDNGAAQELKVDGITGETKKTYGSNSVAYTSTKQVGDLKVTAKLLGVKLADQMRLIGAKQLGGGSKEIYGGASDGIVPDCAILASAPTTDGKIGFFGCYRAKAALGDLAMKTIEDGAYEPEGEDFTFECATDGRDGTATHYYIRGIVEKGDFDKVREYVLRIQPAILSLQSEEKEGKK